MRTTSTITSVMIKWIKMQSHSLSSVYGIIKGRMSRLSQQLVSSVWTNLGTHVLTTVHVQWNDVTLAVHS